MPRVTQYIRDDDFDAWQALENKSEFIHNALAGTHTPSVRYNPPVEIKQPQDVVKVFKEQPINICEHGAGARMCKIKGCKFYQFKKG